MKKAIFVFCCVAIVAISLVICAESQARGAMENADEFAQKAEEQALDGNVRSPQNSNAQIEWDDSTVSGNQQSQASQGSTQDQQY